MRGSRNFEGVGGTMGYCKCTEGATLGELWFAFRPLGSMGGDLGVQGRSPEAHAILHINQKTQRLNDSLPKGGALLQLNSCSKFILLDNIIYYDVLTIDLC